MPSNITRRAALKAIGRGAGSIAILPLLSETGLLAFERIQQVQVAAAPKVLSSSQFATLEAFVEAIIPADDRSPGAKEARVADYIDLLLSEVDETVALQWIGGLAELDEEAVTRFKVPFARLDAAQTDTMLASISANELDPKTPLESFFVMTSTPPSTGITRRRSASTASCSTKAISFSTNSWAATPKTEKTAPIAGRRRRGLAPMVPGLPQHPCVQAWHHRGQTPLPPSCRTPRSR